MKSKTEHINAPQEVRGGVLFLVVTGGMGTNEEGDGVAWGSRTYGQAGDATPLRRVAEELLATLCKHQQLAELVIESSNRRNSSHP